MTIPTAGENAVMGVEQHCALEHFWWECEILHFLKKQYILIYMNMSINAQTISRKMIKQTDNSVSIQVGKLGGWVTKEIGRYS